MGWQFMDPTEGIYILLVESYFGKVTNISRRKYEDVYKVHMSFESGEKISALVGKESMVLFEKVKRGKYITLKITNNYIIIVLEGRYFPDEGYGEFVKKESLKNAIKAKIIL